MSTQDRLPDRLVLAVAEEGSAERFQDRIMPFMSFAMMASSDESTSAASIARTAGMSRKGSAGFLGGEFFDIRARAAATVTIARRCADRQGAALTVAAQRALGYAALPPRRRLGPRILTSLTVSPEHGLPRRLGSCARGLVYGNCAFKAKEQS